MEMEGYLDDIWMWFVKKVIEWALGSFQTLMIWWMDDTAYSVRLTGEPRGVLFTLRGHINWLTAVMAFAGFLVASFRVAIQRKGEPFRVALSQFFELAVIMLTLATAVNLANIAGDEYSQWILEDLRPKDDNWIKHWMRGLKFLGGGGGSTTATMFIVVIFAGAAAISSVAQFALMLFRSGVLIVLVGILPAIAASRFSTYGNYAYKKCIGWLISFILFKPVAATIYAAALKLMASDHESDRLFGLALVAGAIFALPAILRAIMPAVAEDNSHFGVRQIGHFVFGSTAVNAGRGVNVMSGSKHGAGRVGRGLFGRGGYSETTMSQTADWSAGVGSRGRSPRGGGSGGVLSGSTGVPGGGGPGGGPGGDPGGDPGDGPTGGPIGGRGAPGNDSGGFDPYGPGGPWADAPRGWADAPRGADAASGPIPGWEASDYQGAIQSSNEAIRESRGLTGGAAGRSLGGFAPTGQWGTDGPRGADAAQGPVPGREAHDFQVPLQGLNNAINENSGPSGNAGSGGSNGGRYEGPSGADGSR